MNEVEVVKKIEKILIEVLELEGEELKITKEMQFRSDIAEKGLGMSSIDYVEFMVKIESEFNIVYEFDKIIETVGDLVIYILNYNIVGEK